MCVRHIVGHACVATLGVGVAAPTILQRVRVQEFEKGWRGPVYPGQASAEDLAAMLFLDPPERTFPWPRVTVHWDYVKPTAQDKQEEAFLRLMREGYCRSAAAEGSEGGGLGPGASGGAARCGAGYDPKKLQVGLFQFERITDWRWDTRCIDAQRRHYERVAAQAPQLRWDAALVGSLWP